MCFKVLSFKSSILLYASFPPTALLSCGKSCKKKKKKDKSKSSGFLWELFSFCPLVRNIWVEKENNPPYQWAKFYSWWDVLYLLKVMVSRNVRKVLKGDFLVGGGGGYILFLWNSSIWTKTWYYQWQYISYVLSIEKVVTIPLTN